MQDISLITKHPEKYEEAVRVKNLSCDIQRLLETNKIKKHLSHTLQQLQQQHNIDSSKLKQTMNNEEKEKWIFQLRNRKKEISNLKQKLQIISNEYNTLMDLVPGLPSAQTPIGLTDKDNLEIKKHSTPPKSTFPMKDHITLGKDLNMLDFEAGARVAGFQGYFLKNEGSDLHHAILLFARDFLSKRGFSSMTVPVMVTEQSMRGTGYFPLGRNQTFQLEKDKKFLVGTGEVSLCAYFGNRLFEKKELPLAVMTLSDCFRRESGSYGKSTKGLYRVHHFQKVEQVVITEAEPKASKHWHAILMQNSELLLQALELPYRVVEVCTGELGQGQTYKCDIETWMPSRNAYGETHSCSEMLDFQSRRLNIRHKQGNTINFAYTLNNTAIASPRILIPLMENHQQEDGGIRIPKALQPYLNGMKRIEPKKKVSSFQQQPTSF